MGSCSVWGLQFKVSPMRFWDAPDRCMARSRARAPLSGRCDPEAASTSAEEGLWAPSWTLPT